MIEYYEDDRHIVPDEIMMMTSEERRREIARIEAEIAEEKQKHKKLAIA